MRTNALPVFLALGLAGGLSVEAGFASPLQSAKRSKSDKDIAAIGHRKIVRGIDFFSPEKEKVLGKALSEEAERSVHLLLDPGIDGYIRRVAQNITQNSDSQMPIQVRVIDSEEVNACILPGGYQYVTRGLLLLLEQRTGPSAAVTSARNLWRAPAICESIRGSGSAS